MGRDRIHYESEEEIGDALGDVLAEMAAPGVFAGGKQIVATQHDKMADFDVLRLRFNDGSEMNIVGKFEVRYKQPPPFDPNPDLVEHGNQLMLGTPDAED